MRTRAAGLYMDLSKAFDTVQHNQLLLKLYKAGISGLTWHWVKSYLTKRSQVVRLNHTLSDPEEVISGVPQGSVLGPFLFLIQLNDLFALNTIARIFGFVDDTPVVTFASNDELLQRSLQHDTNIALKWFYDNNFIVNASKTKLLHFKYRDDSVERESQLRVIIHSKNCLETGICDSCSAVSPSKTVKYLGVHIDDTLTWHAHVENLQRKLRGLNLQFYQLRKFLSLPVLRRLYMTFYQSRLSYGLIHWGGTYANVLNNLETLQNYTIRIITHKPIFENGKITHTKEIYDTAQVLPLTDLYNKNTLTFFVKHIITEDIKNDILKKRQVNYHVTLPDLTKERSRNQLYYSAFSQFNSFLRDQENCLGLLAANDWRNALLRRIKSDYKIKVL